MSGGVVVRLREREAEHWRERLFPAWDRTGGPAPARAWLYTRPWVGYLGVGLFGTALVGFGLGRGDGIRGVPWGLVGFLGLLLWFHQLHSRLYREWLERRDPSEGPAAPFEGGWWDRLAHHQQAQAEAENRHPDEDVSLSPVVNRLLGLYLTYVGIALVVAVLIAAVT